MKRIAILECYENRGSLLKKTLESVQDKLEIEIFKTYENSFPDLSYDGYVITGGIIRVSQKDIYPHLTKIEDFIKTLAENNVPLLGVCLGHQLIADTFGGVVSEAEELEVGFTQITLDKNYFSELPESIYAFNYHWDYVESIPNDFDILGKSAMCDTHILKHKEKPILGFQFHIEYDKESSIPVLDYLKSEIEEEDLDYDHILSQSKYYEYSQIKKLVQTFLDFA